MNDMDTKIIKNAFLLQVYVLFGTKNVNKNSRFLKSRYNSFIISLLLIQKSEKISELFFRNQVNTKIMSKIEVLGLKI